MTPLPKMRLTSSVLPFTYFSSSLPEDPTPEYLHEIYTSLLEKACSATKHFSEKSGDVVNPGSVARKESPIMYNLALTDKAMVLCPRLSEGLEIKGSNGDLVGPVSLNGTLLGGTLLVKSKQEWDALRNDENKLRDILQAIGVPPITNDKYGKIC
jgi:ATP adenylyltransferase